MPRGAGYWYNRRTNRFITIRDHAQDACANPQRFGLTDKDLIKEVSAKGREWTSSMGHVVIRSEEDRELVIIRVARAGFIRIRHWQGKLGWEFAGDPISSLEVLHRRANSLGLGPHTLVTFTDFGLGLSVTDHYAYFRNDGSKLLNRLIQTWLARYEDRKASQMWTTGDLTKPCAACEGTGRIEAYLTAGGLIICKRCNGTGKVPVG
jgi:hypothetical protein